MTAVEVVPAEAVRSREQLARTAMPGTVLTTSAIEWAATNVEEFDGAVGNPPFVRFQFYDELDRTAIERLGKRTGLSFAGVSNLWLPVLLGALCQLRVGGALAFVVPAECFTGISAGTLRQWLVQNTRDLRFDLFPPGSFPGVLQEVVVLSGRRVANGIGPVTCTIAEHPRCGRPTAAEHVVSSGQEPWTKYLLNRSQLDSVREASELPIVKELGSIAKFEVAAVTGANDYFSVDSPTLDRYELRPWSTPLLPRIRHAPGLRYLQQDHAEADRSGARVHLLDFSERRPNPRLSPGPAAYIAAGERDELHLRYKCRIREPWYRVPLIRIGEMMLSKRSHRFPRAALNEVGVVTTDTIYRGLVKGPGVGRSRDLVAGFHNSLTLLSAELEGRSFGGGVLELVPSEVGRLRVPLIPGFAADLDRLDSISRLFGDSDYLVEETDLLLCKADVGLTQVILERLREARLSLQQRRLDRNASS
ncbi:MAG TPA: hypothetical protein VMS00_05480 [Acidimicrobiales bacterium]|nr:hypothetical protein [Acidimicrobiales bacterium]